MPIERVRNGAAEVAIREFLAAREPATTECLAPLVEYGLGRRVRAWAVTDNGGALCGVLVAARHVPGVWAGDMCLTDHSLAGELGELVQRSHIRTLTGDAAQMAGVLPHVSRIVGSRLYWCYAALPQPLVGSLSAIAATAPELEIRPATRSDVGGVFSVYRSWHQAVRTAPPLRMLLRLRHVVSRGGLRVAIKDGAVVGMVDTRPRSERFEIIDDLVVATHERAVDTAAALARYAGIDAVTRGHGFFFLRATRMPISFPTGTSVEVGAPFRMRVVSLYPRRRFRGQHRLIDLVDRTERALFARMRRSTQKPTS